LLRDWFRDRTRPRTLWRESRRHLPEVIESLRALPPLVRRWVREAEASPRLLPDSTPDTERLIAALDAQSRRRDRTVVAVGCLFAGICALLSLTDLWLGLVLITPSVLYLAFRR